MVKHTPLICRKKSKQIVLACGGLLSYTIEGVQY
jgi:hypothetical protein